MEILCIAGSAPGPITATMSHRGQVRQVAMEIVSHEAGGWKARLAGGEWGVRCHAVPTAILLEAGEAFEAAEAPMVLAAD